MKEKTTIKALIAVDIGATNLRTALVLSDGTVLKKNSLRSPQKGRGGMTVTKQVISQITALKIPTKYEITAIGVSVAGPITNGGDGFNPTNLDFEYVPLVDPLHKKYNIPVSVVNDTNAAVYAEWSCGYGKGGRVRNICYVTVSSGIGSGVIVGGYIALGRDGSFGEVGHCSVDVSYIDGQHDWEYYAAGTGIVRFYQSWCASRGVAPKKKYKTPKSLFAAQKKDVDLKSFFTELGKVNAQGVSNVVMSYNPSVIVFGGSVAQNNWESFIAGVRRHIRRDIISPLPQMRLTELGDDISLIGAAMYAQDFSV